MTIRTDRLVLRPWAEADRAAWMAMMADPEVTEWLGGPVTPDQAAAGFDRVRAHIDQHGFGLWAIERLADGAVIGAAGLLRIPADAAHPLAGGVEIGWRLVRRAWGGGYASEAAAAALAWGLANLDAAEIVAFTAAGNARSQAVMRRIGLERDPGRDFDHPALAPGHPLRPHVVYVARRPS
ncbi:MAG: GNAT family N-acetyltransferase [Caulobacteraceae bacterium]|nr:GNAT family N-acetyltransferase [Caulobacteraceae bacterium]